MKQRNFKFTRSPQNKLLSSSNIKTQPYKKPRKAFFPKQDVKNDDFKKIEEAWLLMRDKKYEKALILFDQVERNTLDSLFLIGKAEALRGNSDPTEAIQLLTSSIKNLIKQKHESEAIIPNFALSYHCHFMGNENKAKKYKKEAFLQIEKTKTQAIVLLEKAELYFQKGPVDFAHDILKMIGEYPDYYPRYIELFDEGEGKATKKQIDFLVRFLKLRAKVHLHLAEAHLSLDESQNAYNDYKELHRIAPRLPEAREGMATANKQWINLVKTSKNGAESTDKDEPMAADLPKEIQEAIDRGEHPGEFIKREFIIKEKKKQNVLADELRVHENTVSYLVREKSDLSPEMAVRLAFKFKKYTASDLLEIQKKYDLAQATKKVLRELPELDPTPV
jgi:addiction module HigA family antidote